jgi:hypothetical protein
MPHPSSSRLLMTCSDMICLGSVSLSLLPRNLSGDSGWELIPNS